MAGIHCPAQVAKGLHTPPADTSGETRVAPVGWGGGIPRNIWPCPRMSVSCLAAQNLGPLCKRGALEIEALPQEEPRIRSTVTGAKLGSRPQKRGSAYPAPCGSFLCLAPVCASHWSTGPCRVRGARQTGRTRAGRWLWQREAAECSSAGKSCGQGWNPRGSFEATGDSGSRGKRGEQMHRGEIRHCVKAGEWRQGPGAWVG